MKILFVCIVVSLAACATPEPQNPEIVVQQIPVDQELERDLTRPFETREYVLDDGSKWRPESPYTVSF